MDRDKVIKGLECCQDGCDSDCPYWTGPLGSASICRSEMERDALALLKVQEPVEPTIDIKHGKSMWRCGSCSTALQPNQIHTKFCFNCGRAVKWDA